MRGGRTEATVITRDQPVDLPPIVPRLEALIVLHPAFLADAAPRPGRGAADRHRRVGVGRPVDPHRHRRGSCRSRRARSPPTSAHRSRPASRSSARSRRSPASPTTNRSRPRRRHLVPPHRAAALEANLAALARGRRRGPRHAGGDRHRERARHRRHGARPLQGLRAVRPGVPARRARDDRRAQRQGLRAAAPPRRLHRMSRVRRGVSRLRVRGVPLRPDEPVDGRRRGARRHDARAPRGLRRDRRGRGRLRLPVLLRLPDAAVHRSARRVRARAPAQPAAC